MANLGTPVSEPSTYGVLVCVNSVDSDGCQMDAGGAIYRNVQTFPIFTFGISAALGPIFGWTHDRFRDDLAEIEPVPNWQAVVFHRGRKYVARRPRLYRVRVGICCARSSRWRSDRSYSTN